MNGEMLKITNVTAGYGEKKVLRGISVSIRKGEFVSLIGSNGAGKSTLDVYKRQDVYRRHTALCSTADL